MYDQALQIFVDCAKLHEKRAEALVRLKHYQDALDAGNRAIELNGSSASAYSEKGRFFTCYDHFGEALDVFDAAISLDPDASTPQRRRAEMLADWGKYDDALALYDHLIRLDLYDSDRGKAKLLARINREEDALADMTSILNRFPQSFRGTGGSSCSFEGASGC